MIIKRNKARNLTALKNLIFYLLNLHQTNQIIFETEKQIELDFGYGFA